jgi:DNA primase
MFTFVEKIEGIDFRGALKILAEKAGVEIVYEKQTGPNKDERERLFAALEDATKMFIRARHQHPEVTEYLKQRGVTDVMIEQFRLGFAPDEWRYVHAGLEEKQHDEKDVVAAGLILSGEKGNYYDRFRSRIMFPLFDSAGRVIGFTGRIWNGDEKSAKYVNSPETALFHKSHFLYGFDRAKLSIRKFNCTLVVEGQMDLIACHQSGYTNTVAISGTALTEEQLTLLGRLSKNLILALDTDKAGIAATIKSASHALSLGFDVKVASFSGGKDASDTVQNGGVEALKEVVKSATPVIAFITNALYEKAKHDERVFVRLIEEELLPVIARVKSKIEQAHTISTLARRLNIQTSVLEESLRAKEQTMKTAMNGATTKGVVQQLPKTNISGFLAGALALAKEKQIDVTEIESDMRTYGITLPDPDQSDMINIEHQIESSYDAFTKDVLKSLFHTYILDFLKHKLDTNTAEIRQAERSADTEKMAQLMTISNTLHKKIAQLHSEK